MKSPKTPINIAAWCGILVLAMVTPLLANTQQGGSDRPSTISVVASPANIIQYVRDRFEVSPAVKIDAPPVHRSPFPHFYQTSITMDDGKQKLVSDVFITDDARCFIAGNVFAMTGATNSEIARCVRDAIKLPATTEVKLGPFARTGFPGFLRSNVTFRYGGKVQTGELYITQDHRTGIFGLVLPFRRDFVEQLIETRNQPSVGPDNARLTIVEYADLECPMCAYFQKFLESELLPRYAGKVSIVFKEFPITSHPWSASAALANECADQIDPSKFLNYRTLIFANQGTISPSNLREQLLSLGEQAGLNRVSLSSCLDTKASESRIEASRNEARTLGVNQTPTFSINGRVVIGIRSAQTFYSVIDEALATAHRRE